MLLSENPADFLPANIRSLRKRLQNSQEELARKIGLNRGNIASYENGTAEPKICNLLKLANLFKVTIIDLTQRDLSQEEAYQTAVSSFRQTTDAEKEFVMSFVQHSGEVEQFLQGIHHCHHYKTKSLDNVSAEMKFALYNFEQLYDVAQSLLEDNKALIDFICCKMQQPQDNQEGRA